MKPLIVVFIIVVSASVCFYFIGFISGQNVCQKIEFTLGSCEEKLAACNVEYKIAKKAYDEKEPKVIFLRKMPTGGSK